MKVVIATPAHLDLIEIAQHIANDSVDRAVSFTDQLIDRCYALGDFPRAYPLVPRYERQGIRRRVYGNYLIFYRAGRDRVEILRIIHGARDYERFLFPEE